MRNQHKLQTLSRTMRGIVEDVLWEGGVLTTDEIYRGVKAKHAQLRQLLPPRWKEKVRQILEAHCISHEGNSWFLEKRKPLEEPHGTSERSINDSNRGQKRTDWASTESYQFLGLALPDMVRNVARMPLDRARGLGASTMCHRSAIALRPSPWQLLFGRHL